MQAQLYESGTHPPDRCPVGVSRPPTWHFGRSGQAVTSPVTDVPCVPTSVEMLAACCKSSLLSIRDAVVCRGCTLGRLPRCSPPPSTARLSFVTLPSMSEVLKRVACCPVSTGLAECKRHSAGSSGLRSVNRRA